MYIDDDMPGITETSLLLSNLLIKENDICTITY